jgi:thiamine kinase-like enzyme
MRQFGEALDGFISEKIAGQVNESDIPKVGFFRMKKQNIVNLLEKPDLSQFVEVYSENFQAASYAMELSDLVKSKIVLSKAKHSALVERHTVSAKTAEEKTILAKLHSIVETLKELHTAGLIVDSDLQRFRQIRVLANSSELQIDPAFFKQIQNRISNNQN